jgi:protein-tyrosine phosphatase
LPVRVLFICHGNICRSTMAESVFADMVRKAGRADDFVIDSAATSYEEIGNPPHRGTVRKLREEGVPLVPHRARHFDAAEYDDWDLIVYMDGENEWGLTRIHRDTQGKYVKLLSFASGRPGNAAPDVADPWYTGNFEATWRDVSKGCAALIAWLLGE